ncbi:MAG: tripartite tricarboxylate transporter substrate binding protein [Burkholderiaceae bacterium]|nr:tripartite tricarboxylate transporter substrate binding protein [Burkholderiaceae bacterium]
MEFLAARRHALHTLGGLSLTLGLGVGARTAAAQAAYPGKPVLIINNFPPGGPSDLLARSIAPVLHELLRQPFVVENRSGAAGNIGAEAVARSQPDGHTLLVGIDTTFTVNPYIYRGMSFKAADVVPVVIMASSGLLVGMHPSTGIKTLEELIAVGKTRALALSSAGNGSPGHLAAQVLADATGIRINPIFYRGNTPAVTTVVGGEVDGGILATPGMLPHVKAGKITALAVTSRRRSDLLPDVPAVGELGLPGLELEVLYLVMAPAATPPAVVQVLQKGILDALQRPDVQTRMNSLDLRFEGLTGAAATERMAALSARYARVVQATGMKVE